MSVQRRRRATMRPDESSSCWGAARKRRHSAPRHPGDRRICCSHSISAVSRSKCVSLSASGSGARITRRGDARRPRSDETHHGISISTEWSPHAAPPALGGIEIVSACTSERSVRDAEFTNGVGAPARRRRSRARRCQSGCAAQAGRVRRRDRDVRGMRSTRPTTGRRCPRSSWTTTHCSNTCVRRTSTGRTQSPFGSVQSCRRSTLRGGERSPPQPANASLTSISCSPPVRALVR